MADGFDRDHPLFEGTLVVRVVGSGRGKDGERPMTLRVLQTTQSASGARSVRLEIADDNDPFFLRTLDVDEAEFSELKHEQRLMVDFADFPAHLVSLLGRVRRPAGPQSSRDDEDDIDSTDDHSSTEPRAGASASHAAMALLQRGPPADRSFIATLHDGAGRSAGPSAPGAAVHIGSLGFGRGGSGSPSLAGASASSSSSSSSSSSGPAGGAGRRLPAFEVVERTSFRDLVHLDVPVAPGGDAAVKAVLASRLELEQTRHEASAAELRATARALKLASARLAELEREAAADRAGAEARQREADAKAAAQLAGAREDAARSEAALAARLQEQAAGERGRAEEELGRARAELKAASDRAEALDRALQGTRQELEKTQQGKAEAERRAAAGEQEAARATARAEAAESRCRKLVATESQLRERCAALGQAAEDRAALAQRADDTRRAVEQSRAASEQTAAMLQESVVSLTAKVREAMRRIDEGDEANARLDREAKEAAAARAQAEQARREALDREAEAARAAAAARAEVEAVRSAAEADRAARAEAERKAADAERETLAQREAAAKHARVIEFLNKELSELRMATTGSASRIAASGTARAAWTNRSAYGTGSPGASTAGTGYGPASSHGDSYAAFAPATPQPSEGAAPTPAAWWRSSQDVPPTGASPVQSPAAPLRSWHGRGHVADSDSKAAPPPRAAFAGLPHPATPPSASAPRAMDPGARGVRRVAVGRARQGGSADASPPSQRSHSGSPPHATSESSAVNVSDVSAGGAARAAGAPSGPGSADTSNPYLKSNWRSAQASTASAYLS